MDNLIATLNRYGQAKGQPVMLDLTAGNEPCLTVTVDQLVDTISHVKTNIGFNQLLDITAVDYLADPRHEGKRFAAVYHLLHMKKNWRLRIKVFLDDEEFLPTITHLFSSANWYEREVYDMYGIYSEGHPDLRRILTDYGFAGHPERKDFPLTGYVEVYYDDKKERVQYQEVTLGQDFRLFGFESPWQGTNKMGAQKGIMPTLPNKLSGDEKGGTPMVVKKITTKKNNRKK